jgi:predicted ribosome quality control (RQC) complex YloA/Tae2 family protein
MGKHSNIIFCDEKDMILDSIKHISGQVSSVREVLPGRDYFIPDSMEKANPLELSQEFFLKTVCRKPLSIAKALYTSFTGISPLMASEISFRSSLDGDMPMDSLNDEEKLHLFKQFSFLMEDVKEGRFSPHIIKKGKEPVAFSSVELSQYAIGEEFSSTPYASISKLLEDFYAEKNSYTRIRQKSVDLRKIVSTALERNRKKYDLQLRQMKDTDKMDKYRVYGELLHTYGHGLAEGSRELSALNYYTDETIKIPLDPQLSPMENAKKYFDRYNKLKRTKEALEELLKETQEVILHLESITTALDIAQSEDDLAQIKEELVQTGYIRKKQNEKKAKLKSRPFHYISSDGFHMYVGKNNLQNEELTFQFAIGNDWWFHAKGIPGSHVLVKSEGKELPDRTFEEAGRLAAYYSKSRGGDKVEIDYLEKKNVKKPNGSKPGFVVYYTNYSLTIDSDISGIEFLE